MENKSIISKAVIVIVLLIAISCVVYYKKNQQQKSPNKGTPQNAATLEKPGQTSNLKQPQHPIEGVVPKEALPRLVDLGAGKCIPCKMMEPILEELRKEYQGKLEVIFIDVWENPKEKELYSINLIPTQIFYDSLGKELFRHEGFYAKEDILKKWKELGIELEK